MSFSLSQPEFDQAAFAHQAGLTDHSMHEYDPTLTDIPMDWSIFSGAIDPSTRYTPQALPVHTAGQQHTFADLENDTLGPLGLVTPQVDSSVGPSRVARRQNAQGQITRADPTRKGPTSRNERPRGKRDAGSSSAPASQPVANPSHISQASGSNTRPHKNSSREQSATGNAVLTASDPQQRSASPALSATAEDESMPANKGKKQRLTNLDRRKICVYNRDNPHIRQEDIAKTFGVERSTVSKVLKEKKRWLGVSPDETLEIAKNRPPKFADIEVKLQEWLVERMDAGVTVCDQEIREKSLEFAKGSPTALAKFKASSGWLDNFKQRIGMRRGIYHGFGRNNEKDIALGNGAAEPDFPPFEPFGPTLMDNICRGGYYDPQGEGADAIMFEVPRFKTSARKLMEKRGNRGWHELSKEEQEQSQRDGDDDMYPHFEMARLESELEEQAIAEAEKETTEAEKAAERAGEPFDFKREFDLAVHAKLAAIDYETIDVPELDIPQSGYHPDEIDLTPGPTGQRAHEAIWDIIRFAMPRRGRVFSNMHCAMLLEMWARIMIIYERQRRATARQSRYELIYMTDRSGKEQQADDMVAEKERDFALNPTGEPTGEDIVAMQTRKDDLETLKELQSARDEFEADPKAKKWLAAVHDAEATEHPSYGEDADTPELAEAPASSASLPPDLPDLNTHSFPLNTPSFSASPLRREPEIHNPSSALAFDHEPRIHDPSSAFAFINHETPGFPQHLFPQHDLGDAFALSLDPGGDCFDAVMSGASSS